MQKIDDASGLGPKEPGPETEALREFFPDGGRFSWSGTVKAGGMAPGSSEMVGEGSGKVKWIMDGLWAMCEFQQDQFIKGRKILSWKLHLVVGWDFLAREYRAVGVDTNGSALIFKCKIEGRVFTLATDAIVAGRPAKLRMRQDYTDPNAVLWKNEFSVNDGPWQLIEEYVVRPQSAEN